MLCSKILSVSLYALGGRGLFLCRGVQLDELGEKSGWGREQEEEGREGERIGRLPK